MKLLSGQKRGKDKREVRSIQKTLNTKKKGRKAQKAQVKMIETTMVLLVFVFLFALLFVFYTRFQLFEIDKLANRIEEERATSLLNKIIAMPELRCSISFGSAAEVNCIDTLKLLAFSSRAQNADEFSSLNEVKIVRQYPAPAVQTNLSCGFAADYPRNCGFWQLKKQERGQSRISFDTFVTLCMQKEASLYECEIGRLIVGVPK